MVCEASKKDGNPCQASSKAGSPFCGRHTPAAGNVGLEATVQGGDLLLSLCALRDRLAAEIDQCGSGRDVASLSARLVEVLARVDELERDRGQVKGTSLDEFTRRRQARGAAAG